MERLTKRDTEGKVFLINIKEKERGISGPRNTLDSIVQGCQRLAQYEDLGYSPEELTLILSTLKKEKVQKLLNKKPGIFKINLHRWANFSNV